MMMRARIARSWRWLMMLALLGLAAVGVGWLLLSQAPLIGYLVPVLLTLGAWLLWRLAPAERLTLGDSPRLDLSRLREGRLRDHTLHAVGYYQQLRALAETLPAGPTRQQLRAQLPALLATLRALYDLCLALQAYELGESQPPALRHVSATAGAALVGTIEEVIHSVLRRFSETYNLLRQSWTGSMVDATLLATLLEELQQATAALRECSATFAVTGAGPAADRPFGDEP